MKKYLIVWTPSWKIEKSYSTAGSAKGAMTKKYSKKKDAENYELMTREEFNERDVEVPVRNIMSGATVMIRRSEVGGCCDPSTERYHCM